MSNKLSAKQQDFVNEYLIDGNATRSAEQAGYSRKTAPEQGSRLLKNVKVKAELERKKAKVTKKLEYSRESIIQTLLDIMEANKDQRPTITIKAIEVINKMSGFDIPEENIQRTDNTFQIKIVRNNGDNSNGSI
jgi:phage terminase small subunit